MSAQKWKIRLRPTELLNFQVINNNRIFYYIEQAPEVLGNIFRRRYRLDSNMGIETGTCGVADLHGTSNNGTKISALVTHSLASYVPCAENLTKNSPATSTFGWWDPYLPNIPLHLVSITSYLIHSANIDLADTHVSSQLPLFRILWSKRNLTGVLHNTVHRILNVYLYHCHLCR